MEQENFSQGCRFEPSPFDLWIEATMISAPVPGIGLEL